jgi:hypothetical protein
MSTFSNPLTEYQPQLESLDVAGRTAYGEPPPWGVFRESEEIELAAALLEVRDEDELDHFLGDLIRGAGKVLGKVIGGPAVKAIGGVLKGLAKTALPIAGGALGGMVGGPLGAQVGSVLASQAGRIFGLELEGLSPEDREFEAARQFVRFAGAAVGNVLEAPPHPTSEGRIYKAAMEAAQVHAPGFVPRSWHSRRNLESNTGGIAMHDIDRTQVGFGNEFENEPEAEMDPAAQLMEITTEEEFEQFLGDLISRAVSAAGSFLSTPTGKALGGLLKGAAKKILPLVEQVAGEFESDDEMEFEQREFEAVQTFVNLAQEAAVKAAQAPPDADPAAVARKAVADAAQVHAPALLVPAAPAKHSHGGCGCGGTGSKGKQAGQWVRRGNQIIVFGV